MPARRFPISGAAIAEAARFIAKGGRRYTKAGEPDHPSLRQVAAHLVARGLVDEKPAAATLARALARAGVVLPAHWRSRTDGRCSLEANISSPGKQVGIPATLCSSVDDGGTTRTGRRPQPALDHPWRPSAKKPGSEHLPGRRIEGMPGAAAP